MKNSIIIVLLISIVACTQERKLEYEVNNVNLLPSDAPKTKLKSEEQYISVLYSNLFQRSLSADELFDISNATASLGDKQLAHQMIVSNFMSKADIKLPADTLMRNQTDKFISDAYIRFLIRRPTQAELTYWNTYIKGHSKVNVIQVYTAFALCDEYGYY